MNLLTRFKTVLHTEPTKKILGHKENGLWKWVTREELKNKILYCADVLLHSGVNPNDRIMYKGNNSVNWVAWDIATNSLGATFVPLYDNQKDSYVNHIIEDCDPAFFITQDNYKNVPILRDIIEDHKYDKELFNYGENNISKLIYTSGTTGKPKGVMLSHSNILSNIGNIETRFHDLQFDKEYTSLNILPWAHIYGLTTELYYNLLNNNKVAISSGPQDFVKEINQIQPDLLYLVPRVLQMIKSKLEILDKPLLRLLLPTVIKRVFGKELITVFVGGSQLDENTKAFYLKYGVNICEGYGSTEISPMVSVNHINEPRNINSIGKILDNTIVEIIDNEICVAGPSVMEGYYNNIKATDDAFIIKDEKKFYKTGDEGYVKDGFLFYKGRISENYKLSNGKFVNISELENVVKKYTNQPFVVYGNNKDYNIIICDRDSNLSTNIIDIINEELDTYLQIKKILYLNPGSLQQTMTPKMSIKRKEVEMMFEDEIKEIYKD